MGVCKARDKYWGIAEVVNSNLLSVTIRYPGIDKTAKLVWFITGVYISGSTPGGQVPPVKKEEGEIPTTPVKKEEEEEGECKESKNGRAGDTELVKDLRNQLKYVQRRLGNFKWLICLRKKQRLNSFESCLGYGTVKSKFSQFNMFKKNHSEAALCFFELLILKAVFPVFIFYFLFSLIERPKDH